MTKQHKVLLFPFVLFVLMLVSCQAPLEDELKETSNIETLAPDMQTESSPYPYEGEVTCKLMPIDWTFLETDIPLLISSLAESDYSALYVDLDKFVRVISANDIQISYDTGDTWTKLNTEEVLTNEFSEWLWANDPIPGYSMQDLQERLNNGAEVRHIVFDDKQEMYFVIDENGVQIELVQPERIESVLIDGIRLMFTSTNTNYSLSNNMIYAFEDILKDSGITEKSEVSSEWNSVIEHLIENGANLYNPPQTI